LSEPTNGAGGNSAHGVQAREVACPEHRPDMLVFREEARVTSALDVARPLQRILDEIGPRFRVAPKFRNDCQQILEALLRAGELECALADAARETHPNAAALTDSLAEAFLGLPNRGITPQLSWLDTLHLSGSVRLSRPEGFAFYALHPLDFVDTLKQHNESPCAAAIVGIRSIGTTLSATVRTCFAGKGIPAERTTVRPQGHPFAREVMLTDAQRKLLRRLLSQNATFYVVDEGPGFSGSSFLATAEALVATGVPPSKITLMCSTKPNLSALLARDAATRWKAFKTLVVQTGTRIPSEARDFFGAGMWRGRCFPNPSEWPASWVQNERLKYLSEDGRMMFRFDGLGHYGAELRSRYAGVGEAGFGPICDHAGNGFTSFPMLSGRPLRMVSQRALMRAAEYCAFRADACAAEVLSTDSLEHMARINAERGLGCCLGENFRLEVVRPVIADGKMMLHEWLESDGELLKLDSAAHGDDHFFPGPTDIAWDLAGTTIEWSLDDGQSELFLSLYRNLSGDDARLRLRSYQLAYGAFRMGYSKMGALAMQGSEEESRLWREYDCYRRKLSQLLNRSFEFQGESF
jgi:hypothetical protein